MILIKLISILIGFVLVFATLPSEAKVFWYNYPPVKQSLEDGARPFPYHVNRVHEKRGPIDLIFNVIKQLVTSRQKKPKSLEDFESIANKCARLFGSIYGTKQQKLLCLEKLKKVRQNPNYHAKKSKEINDKEFTDLTRATYSSESNIRTDVMYGPEFSSDYMDFKNLRSNDEADDFKYIDLNWRKANMRNEMDSIRHQRTLYTDSDTDESEEEQEENKNYSKKPKRFQVIDNDKTRDKSEDISIENSDDTKDDTSSFEYTVPSKPDKKDINLNNEYYLQGNFDSSDLETMMKKSKKKEHYLQGNDDFSEDEFEEPVKTYKKKKKSNKKKSNQKKEYYLQGSRLISPSSDEDGRRRLPHFLPKRFHWNEEEMQNLGYFWFNGPQGKYAKLRLRP